MGNWLRGLARIFVGTPVRFLVTVAVIAAVYAVNHPGFLQNAINQVLGEIHAGVSPWIGPMFQLAIFVFAIYFIVSAPFRKRGGKK